MDGFERRCAVELGKVRIWQAKRQASVQMQGTRFQKLRTDTLPLVGFDHLHTSKHRDATFRTQAHRADNSLARGGDNDRVICIDTPAVSGSSVKRRDLRYIGILGESDCDHANPGVEISDAVGVRRIEGLSDSTDVQRFCSQWSYEFMTTSQSQYPPCSFSQASVVWRSATRSASHISVKRSV